MGGGMGGGAGLGEGVEGGGGGDAGGRGGGSGGGGLRYRGSTVTWSCKAALSENGGARHMCHVP